VGLEQARQELGSIMRDIVREHPADYPREAGIRITPLREYMVDRVSTAMWVLLGAVGFVLLMACANVANLVLARATGRAREMAVRAALGAGRSRLVRQLILECLLLAAASGVVGLVLASLATSALVAYGSRELPRIAEIGTDATVLWFTLGVSVLTVALFGVMPALRASRVDLVSALKDTGRGTDGRARLTMRSVLVAAQLALAFVLVMGAGLLGKSFLRLTGVDPGYDPHNVLTLGVYAYGQRYQKPEAELNLYAQVKERLRATPGVESVGMSSVLPMGSFDRRGFHIQERPLANPADAPSADTYSVSPDYFRVMRIPLKRGRFFTDADRQGGPLVALISESCARSQFANTDPIGQHIQLGGKDWLTIVGIVGDVRQYGLDRPSNMEAYLAQAQNLNFGYNMVLRTTVEPQRLEKAVRSAFLEADATQPVFQVRPMDAYLSDSLAARTFTLSLLGLFGALALALAAIGIYGVISYAVSARTREVGIRMALGAGRREVLSMVLRQGVSLIVLGIVCGLAASMALSRFLSTLLFEVRPTDPATYGLAALGLSAVALLATYVPARRATRIDPMAALRMD
jgi:putative ABC transport system permease protein